MEKADIQTAERVPSLVADDLAASKTAKVQNVAYSDAIAKDNLSRRATSVLKLYAIVIFVTLSIDVYPGFQIPNMLIVCRQLW